jgi:hypothetical protein
MDQREHSRLLYLVEAIESAPNKAEKLLKTIDVSNISSEFSIEFEKLWNAVETNSVLEVVAEIKNRLR